MSDSSNRSGLDPRAAGQDPELADALAKLSQGLGDGEDPLYYDWRDGSRQPAPDRRRASATRLWQGAGLVAVIVGAAMAAFVLFPRDRASTVPLAAAVASASSSASSFASNSPRPIASPQASASEAVSLPPVETMARTRRDAAAGPGRYPPSTATGQVPVGPAEF
jgi:hypothetical protein